MALEAIITVELNKPGLGLPQTIRVPQGSRISFQYRGVDDFFGFFAGPSIRIILYFQGKLLNGIQRNTMIDTERRFRFKIDGLRTGDVGVIAQGVASEKGEYKYGVRIESNGTVLTDEDPYIIVE